MEANKIRGGFKDTPNKLLLPLSLGVSSVSLLHVLDQHRQAHLEKSGRTTYTLHVLFVDQALESDQEVSDEILRSLRQRFPLHSYSIIHLGDIFAYHEIEVEGIFETGSNDQGASSFSHQDRLSHLLSSLPSFSSRSDIIATLRMRLISAFAQRHDCYGVLFGDSTTRLAERTLSETAKGRGGSLPWLTADGMSSTGMRIIYPMRDLLKKELLMYTDLTEPPLTPLIKSAVSSTHGPVSSKEITIDGLMSQYFGSVEQDYPSIVANVVRTSGRLLAPSTSHRSNLCRICGLPVENSAQAWAGNQETPVAANSVENKTIHGNSSLCYGCVRAVGGNNATLGST